MTVIYGKDSCPYTQAALEDYRRRGGEVEYHDVKRDPSAMERMLVHSAGKRRVPVIVEGRRVTIGFGGT
jgi:glutaredoxin 3